MRVINAPVEYKQQLDFPQAAVVYFCGILIISLVH